MEGLPDISGVWNRLDTVGGHSYGGVSATFPRAQLNPEFEAKLPPPPPPEAPPPTYDIRAQNDPAPRCAVGGGPGTGNTSPTINSAGHVDRRVPGSRADAARRRAGRSLHVRRRSSVSGALQRALYNRPLGERRVRRQDARVRSRHDRVRPRLDRSRRPSSSKHSGYRRTASA